MKKVMLFFLGIGNGICAMTPHPKDERVNVFNMESRTEFEESILEQLNAQNRRLSTLTELVYLLTRESIKQKVFLEKIYAEVLKCKKHIPHNLSQTERAYLKLNSSTEEEYEPVSSGDSGYDADDEGGDSLSVLFSNLDSVHIEDDEEDSE